MADIEPGVRQAAIEEAIATLKDAAAFTVHSPSPVSHTVIEVSGVDEPGAIAALGTYLTSLIAGAITVDMRVVELLLEESLDYGAELRAEVEAAIGSSNGAITQAFREDRRDPWIAECLAHTLLIIHRGDVGTCIPATLHAVTLPHDKPTQQGLDLVGVYEAETGPGLCIGESKASQNWPAQHLSKAINLFREIDESRRNHQIRTVILNTLLAHIPDPLRGQISGMFWRDQRLYLPLIGYAESAGFNPASERPQTFGTLQVPVEMRRFVVMPLANYEQFFDDISDAMRTAVDTFA